MGVADLCFVLLCSGMPSTQLFLNSSPEMMDGQPDQGQTVHPGLVEGCRVSLGKLTSGAVPSFGGCGVPPGNGAHPQFPNRPVGKVRWIHPPPVWS